MKPTSKLNSTSGQRWVKVEPTDRSNESKVESKASLQESMMKKAETAIVLGNAPRKLAGRGSSRRPAWRGRPRRGRQAGVVPRIPPVLPSSITSHHVFRFSVTSTQSGTSITWANLAGITGVIGTVTNSTAVAFCSSMRIKHITIYPAVNASSVGRQEIFFATPSAGVYTKDESKMEGLPVGVTATGPMRFVPPSNSEVGEWFTAGSVGAVGNTIFTVYATAGSIIDISMSWTHSNNAGSASITGFTTVAVGSYYYLALDGTAGTMPPMALPTTV